MTSLLVTQDYTYFGCDAQGMMSWKDVDGCGHGLTDVPPRNLPDKTAERFWKTPEQPMTSKDSNQASPGYKSRPLAPHQSVECWAGFIQSAPEHRFSLLRINNYLEAFFLMGYDTASAGYRSPTFRIRVMDPLRWGQNVLPKRRDQITHWRSIISQNNWILGYTTGKNSLHWTELTNRPFCLEAFAETP